MQKPFGSLLLFSGLIFNDCNEPNGDQAAVFQKINDVTLANSKARKIQYESSKSVWVGITNSLA